ncbi:hypothetical protein [Microbacterium sp. 179-I 3D4 NHS]|uniref:hypothetical protein n=1 Tax=Microbacterium sp. 179-I 3D4 NHS TaxID=3142381 RepID=UPI0039A1D161
MPLVRASRLAAVALLTAALLPLSGCLYAQIPVETPAADRPTTTPAPSDTPDAVEELPASLTFADGQDLPVTAYIEWGDGLISDDGWEVDAPDDGNGNWSYITRDGTCTAQFWQGTLGDVAVAGDDSATSDAIIATIVGATREEVATYGTDGELGYQAGGVGGVDARQVSGEDGDRTWIMTARGFSRLGVGLYVIADCTGADVEAILGEITEKNAVVVTP